MSKKRRNFILNVEFEIDNQVAKTIDLIEIETSLLTALKEALNEDRLIIKETEIKSSKDLVFDIVIIN